MKTYLIPFLMCFTTLNIFAQFAPTGCDDLTPGGVSTTFMNNIIQRDYSFNKGYLACEDVSAGGYAGFAFKSQFSVTNLTGIKNLFELKIGSNQLLLFRFNNQKIEVLRDVIYRPCNSWSNGQCQSFGTIVKGVMTFSTWDDHFIESNTGWISVLVLDNQMRIKVSNEENGPVKTEFNYEGLHLSGVDQELADHSTDDASISVYANSSGINLTNIYFTSATFGSNPAIVIDDNLKSPETNFPLSGSGTLLRGTTANELAKDVEEENFTSKILLYPNPSKDGTFTLDFVLKADSTVRFEIVNAVGQLVFSKQNQLVSKGNNSFLFGKEDANLKSGLYIVNVITNEFSKSLKLIVE